MGQFKNPQITSNCKGVYCIYFLPGVKGKMSKRKKIEFSHIYNYS